MRSAHALAIVVLAAAAACGPKDAPAPPEPPATLADLAWLDGGWSYESYSGGVYFIHQPGVVWVIEMTATSYEVNSIDAGSDGKLRFWPHREGGSKLVYTASRHGDGWITFASSAQLDISAYTFERVTDETGARLVMTRHTPTGPNNSGMRAAPPCADGAAQVEEQLAIVHRTPVFVCPSPYGEGRYAATVATDGKTTYAAVWADISGTLTRLHEEHRP
ncbi:MAG TPA: hypothetical protein VM261_08375 [Kofleriaceae bacterium]|nr:hypothetical protein [Kofleriaceae bacterium]